MNDDLHRIFFKGGVTSPGELKDSIAMLEAAGLQEVYFGSRQDLLFPLPHKSKKQLELLSEFNTNIVADRTYQNIVCSYVSADIFDMTHWLKGSTYLYLLEQFNYQPKLKINIADPKQRLVPLFSGNLNFIASAEEDYWYLNVMLPHWKNKAFYPVLIYSWDIVKIAKVIEEVFTGIDNVDQLFTIINQQLETNNKNIQEPLQTPYLTFPYYEGMNRMGLDQYWLGLYWRNNRYNLKFLKEFCGFCLDNGIGKICITPWKSLIVKGIKTQSRPALERFLGLNGINVRHSQLEMNWHLPVDDAEAFELKRFLLRNFDQNDISTYGLTFGISNDVGKRSHFSSIVIEKNAPPKLVADFEVRPSYNVLHFKNFDPNTDTYIVYAQDVDKVELSGLLMELSKKYFEQLYKVAEPTIQKEPNKPKDKGRKVHQCQNCYTIYDDVVGDKKNKIPKNTAFNQLPSLFTCPTCGASLAKFKPIQLELHS